MIKESVLILAARSDIGKAVAHEFASLGHPVQLAARNIETLEVDMSDISLRYSVPVTLHEFDALETETHASFVDALPELPEIAICAVGLMEPQDRTQEDIGAFTRVMRSNFEGPANIMAELANRFETRGSGTLVGISSVAGERGRASNYSYGSAKAGFTAFLSGLRNRMAKRGVHVVTVLPGFVETRMTEGMDLPARLTAQPSEVASGIARAVEKKRNVVYIRPIWRVIMFIIRSIPEFIFKKMSI
ncbi:SDR family oxidoreductase [Roseovarius faecimaris]|uniref:SDR family oxidoreductase n=1 Tax=Roseovarius faecimaris TaxID=2494550 RepID=A0A6I6INP5_9RHOB|nr:SDR family oxidoreductase [Roseovarius faecimaris]QGX98295.1 SDR family oxidoreductase [Roseovarius faecimaris]